MLNIINQSKVVKLQDLLPNKVFVEDVIEVNEIVVTIQTIDDYLYLQFLLIENNEKELREFVNLFPESLLGTSSQIISAMKLALINYKFIQVSLQYI